MTGDDDRLIKECRSGNTAAFGELVLRYQDRLYNTVLRLMNNGEDARDVVQETFLHAYLSLHTFKGDALFFTWLYRIAINTAISMKRKQKPALRIRQATNAGYAVDLLDSSVGASPAHGLENAEEERRIQVALSKLSVEHRAVLVMKDVDGKKYEEMAEILGVPVGTIRSRLHRARLEIRDILLQEVKGDS